MSLCNISRVPSISRLLRNGWDTTNVHASEKRAIGRTAGAGWSHRKCLPEGGRENSRVPHIWRSLIAPDVGYHQSSPAPDLCSLIPDPRFADYFPRPSHNNSQESEAFLTDRTRNSLSWKILQTTLLL
jgi:hypothetical protein